jgi:glycine/D-amino acid oxidase-like deaminating enzyme
MGDPATDVVVVGAGISGLSTACELARRGLHVTVLEKDDVGYEASGRNMGAIGLLGKHAADIAAASVSAWESLTNGRPGDFGLQNTGRLYLAHDLEDLRLIEGMTKHAAEHGIEVCLLTPADVRARFPFIGIDTCGAAFSSVDAQVDPQKVMAVFKETALGLGVDVRVGSMARSIDVVAGKIRGVIADSARVEASAVLVAGGVWSYRLLHRIGVDLPYQLVELFHGFTEPQPRLFDFFLRGPKYGARQLEDGAIRFTGGYRSPGVWHGLSLHDLRDMRLWMPQLWRNRSQVHMRFEPALTLFEIRSGLGLAPVAPTQFDPHVPMRGLLQEFRGLQDVIPALRAATVVNAFGGVVDLTPDALPILGPIERIPGLHVALGFNGQGFGLGPVVGRMLADSILGRTSPVPLYPYRWSRFAEGPVATPDHLI